MCWRPRRAGSSSPASGEAKEGFLGNRLDPGACYFERDEWLVVRSPPAPSAAQAGQTPYETAKDLRSQPTRIRHASSQTCFRTFRISAIVILKPSLLHLGGRFGTRKWLPGQVTPRKSSGVILIGLCAGRAHDPCRFQHQPSRAEMWIARRPSELRL
jgi:hypothetical protein